MVLHRSHSGHPKETEEDSNVVPNSVLKVGQPMYEMYSIRHQVLEKWSRMKKGRTNENSTVFNTFDFDSLNTNHYFRALW